MSEEMTLRQALTKLSPEDRERYDLDMIAYGNAAIKECDDGTVIYVSLKDLPPSLTERKRKP